MNTCTRLTIINKIGSVIMRIIEININIDSAIVIDIPGIDGCIERNDRHVIIMKPNAPIITEQVIMPIIIANILKVIFMNLPTTPPIVEAFCFMSRFEM